MGMDSAIPQVFSGATAITIEGAGAGESISMAFLGEFSWTRTGRVSVEARERSRHVAGGPVVVETEDSDISISLSGHITSYLGDSDVHPYEAFTKTGLAASWTSTVQGGAHGLRLKFRGKNPATGAEQTLTFRYCVPQSIEINPNGDRGLAQISVELLDYENDPQIA